MTLRLNTSSAPTAIGQADFGIRPALPADAEALSVFAARTFVDTYGQYNRREDLEMYLATFYGVAQQTAELSDPQMATFVACLGDRLAAYAQLRRGPPPVCGVGDAPVELYRFYVDKTWHGCGLSQSLLTTARSAARRFGGTTLWLKVWEHNPRAIAFYKKAAFVDVGVTDFFVGTDRQTDRVLALDLLLLDDAQIPVPDGAASGP